MVASARSSCEARRCQRTAGAVPIRLYCEVGARVETRVRRGRDARGKSSRVARLGYAPARPALRVWKPFQPFMLIPAFFCAPVHVPWTCNAGRAGAHPYRATRADHTGATRVRAALVQLRIPPRQNAPPNPGAGPLSVYAVILRATARGNFRFPEANSPVRRWFEKN